MRGTLGRSFDTPHEKASMSKPTARRPARRRPGTRPRGVVTLALAVIAAAPAAAPGVASAPLSAQVTGPSPSTALHLSLWGTVVPVGAGAFLASKTAGDGLSAVLIMGGLVAGPALGLAYGGDTPRALAGAAVRGLVIGATLGAIAATCDRCLEEDEYVPVGLFLAGAAATTVLVVRDVVAAPRTARRSSEAGGSAARPERTTTVTPWLPLGERGAGLRVVVPFR